MFSQVSVCSRGGGEVYTNPYQTDKPLGKTPPQADTPRQTPPWADTTQADTPPTRWLLKRTVRVLLECILLSKMFVEYLTF